MQWMKIKSASKRAGDVSPKLLYREIKAGRLKAARIGAGRNMLTSDEFIDEWLTERAAAPQELA